MLAAGKGERLRPLTETRPKPLIPVPGGNLLCRHLSLAVPAYGPDEIIIVASYMAGAIREELERCGIKARVIEQGGELGTGHAIARAMAESSSEDFLIIYSDVVVSREAYEILANAKPPAILAARVDKPWEYGVLLVKEGVMKGIVEKPEPGKEPGNLVLAGMMRLAERHQPFFEALAPSPRGEYEATDALQAIADVEDVSIIEAPGFWLDVGRPWDVIEAAKLIMTEERPRIKGEVHPTAVLEGDVIVEEGAIIGPYAVVEGPAYISRGARIGPHAYIRPWTFLAPGAYVGHVTEVKASVFFENAKAPHLNYVGDSVLGEHVNLGAGTVTANLRFDHKTIKVNIKGRRIDTGRRKLGAIIGGHAQTGINVSLLPGVKIGSYAIVYPGCVVYRDVEARGVYKCGMQR